MMASFRTLAVGFAMRHLSFSLHRGRRYYETDNERKQDFAEAERTFDQMAEVYRQCGYALSELPKATPAARTAFILRQLHLDS